MTKKCCVPGCKSNYDSSLKAEQKQTYISMFTFPQQKEKLNKWLRAIPRKNWSPSKYSRVCANHFSENDIIRFEKSYNSDGTFKHDVPLKNPRLADNAIPCIFPNLPAYLSNDSGSCSHRRDPEERREKLFEEHRAKIENFLQADLIGNFQDLCNNFSNKVKLFNWEVKVCEQFLYFYTMNFEGPLSITNSLKISSDLLVSVYLNTNELSENDLKWLLPSGLKLTKWSQLENLLARYKSTNMAEFTKETLVWYLQLSLKYLLLASNISNNEENFNYTAHITLICDQLKQIVNSRIRYDSSTVIMAFQLYSQSPACYKLLRNFLILPHTRYLQFISSALDVSPDKDINSENYLSHICKNLSERERVVSLLCDEIYITQRLDYRSKKIVGTASNNSDELGKTALTFMISSCFGNTSEVVKILPVNNIKGTDLSSVAMQVITFVQKCGFTVLCLITDNHSINRTMFKKLANTGTSMTNPSDSTKTIFFMYDFVHLFKNIRNNWINLKNVDQTFVFPSFEQSCEADVLNYAKFKHFRDVYEDEKNSTIKQAFKLNYKTIYPSNLERQKVYLVDNLFHRSTIACLKTKPECEGTVQFLEIIRHWWDIVSLRSTLKGLQTKNCWRKPFENRDDPRFQFLKNFIMWLEKWHTIPNNNGHLSNETYSALHQSTTVLIELLVYIFDHFTNVDYVLPGKFTTEDLEKRFGIYRSLCGCNYNVSYDDILSAEKKIRVRHLLDSSHSSLADIRSAIEVSEVENIVSIETLIEPFQDILGNLAYFNCDLDQSVKMYICGYAAHAVCKKLQCDLCKTFIRKGKGSTIPGNQYFNNLQRGGLSEAQENVDYLFVHMCSIFETIINHSEYSYKFLASENQKDILVSLTSESVRDELWFDDFKYLCQCGQNLLKIFSNLCSIFANILLNNYVKKINNKHLETTKRKATSSTENKNKTRKLKSLQK